MPKYAVHLCNTSHYFGYCQAIHEKGRYKGEQCVQMRADGDELYCPKHRFRADQEQKQSGGTET